MSIVDEMRRRRNKEVGRLGISDTEVSKYIQKIEEFVFELQEKEMAKTKFSITLAMREEMGQYRLCVTGNSVVQTIFPEAMTKENMLYLFDRIRQHFCDMEGANVPDFPANRWEWDVRNKTYIEFLL